MEVTAEQLSLEREANLEPALEIAEFILREVSGDVVEAEKPKPSLGNKRVLKFTVLLFSTITSAQILGAIASNSLALAIDSVSMAVDVGTLVLNCIVEKQVGKPWHRESELLGTGISLGTLLLFTALLMHEAIDKGINLDPSEDDVNPYIVMGFALWGILFDCTAMLAFWRNSRANKEGKGINMWTAFMHVAADFCRSISTLVSSLLVLGGGLNSVEVDAWAGLVVGATILFGALGGTLAWQKMLWHYFKDSSQQQATLPLDGNENPMEDSPLENNEKPMKDMEKPSEKSSGQV